MSSVGNSPESNGRGRRVGQLLTLTSKLVLEVCVPHKGLTRDSSQRLFKPEKGYTVRVVLGSESCRTHMFWTASLVLCTCCKIVIFPHL